MACSLAYPCGGKARLVVVLADAALYECFGSAHTIRVGAPAPKWKPAQAQHDISPYRTRGRPRTRRCRWGKCKSFPTRTSVYCYSHRMR